MRKGQKSMDLAVIGIGKVGAALGAKWLAAGHAVRFGVREVNSEKALTLRHSLSGDFDIVSLDKAIAFGEAVVFAVPGAALPGIVAEHARALNHKMLIDATNKVREADMSGIPAFAEYTPSALVYRAFSSLGWENYAQPYFGDLQADLFYCGPDQAEPRKAVEALIADVGLRPIWLGGLEQAPLVDGVTRVWLTLTRGQGRDRHLAFKVLMD
jgi:predicted dinucleotide-binding enzyme